jgi:ribonuclease-3
MARQARVTLTELEARIGHRFIDKDLIGRALTHVSAVVSDGARGDTYQRLEFLGDRVLGLAIADMLYAEFPNAEEGELSRRLADLVRKESCGEVAAEWGVGAHLRLGDGEVQTGGRTKGAILADVCESIVGAVFLDAGYPAALRVVTDAWRMRMLAPRRPLLDAKTALQEWAQGRGLATPLYHEVTRSGPAHAPEFTINVGVEGFAAAEGSGPSKRAGEQAAAASFMIREGIWSEPGRKLGAA